MTSRIVLAGLLAVVLSQSPGQAQPASRVADLATTGSPAAGSAPSQLTPLRDGRIVFAASEPGSGSELWASDGTAAGSALLADICPGPCDANPGILGVLDGTALFVVATEEHQIRIWRTDGTRSGTVSLRDGGAPLQVSQEFAQPPLPSVVFKGSLYFEACGAAQGCGVWRTDGTPAGTRLFLPQARMGKRRHLQAVVAAEGRAYFTVSFPSVGTSFLWATDGTEAGTVRLANLKFLARGLTPVGKRLFFVSWVNGEELWVSDGTRAGTRPVTNFRPRLPFGHEGDGGGPPVLLAAQDRVDFAADDGVHGWEIWRSDGTPDGTRRLTDFAAKQPFDPVGLSLAEVNGKLLVPVDGPTGRSLWTSNGRSMVRLHECLGGCEDPRPPVLVPHGNRVLFTAGPGFGTELWSTDGTAAGTGELLSEIHLEPWDLGGLAVVNVQGSDGDQLWTTDGTPAGTHQLSHLPAGTRVGALPVAAGDKIFFSADHGDGTELWVRENGQERQAANLASDATSSWPTSLVAVGPHLVFQAGRPGGPLQTGLRALWRSDGTEASTSPLLDPFELPTQCDFTYCFASMAAADGWLAIVHTPNDSRPELWGTDGTTAGTARLLTVTAPDRLDEKLAAFQGLVLFFVRRSGELEVWRSDGTPAGTFRIAERAGEDIRSVGGTGTEAYFLLGSSASHELWQTDGTAEGTVKVAELSPGFANVLFPPVRIGPLVAFEISLNGGTNELWASDGTAAGTVKIQGDLRPALEEDAAGGVLYFVTQREPGFELWRTDGTAAGTALLRSWPDDVPTGLTAFAGKLFFAAPGPLGVEPWTSDGTAAGTRLLRDINPDGGSHPASFAVRDDRLYFSAFDSAHGFELWASDGTAAGTRLVQDIVPGPLSSAPDFLTTVGGRLYFNADDGVTGRELWMLPPDGF
jgi:ELWxxDGT repeat protein